MEIMKAGALYFLLVFGAGFVLGTIRVPWVVPRWGPRVAELAEAPIMLAVIVAAAPVVVRRFALPSALSLRFGVGLIAVGLMLLAEFTVVLRLRDMTIVDYVASRDPVTATVYSEFAERIAAFQPPAPGHLGRG